VKRRTVHGHQQPTRAEWDLLRSRLIALECVVMAVLADASPAQLAHAQTLAAQYAQRGGFARHPLTARAVDQVDHMLLQARQLRDA
jgi:hypothetical protein